MKPKKFGRELGLKISVNERRQRFTLGLWDSVRDEITIDPRQHKVAKEIIFLHELMHALDDWMIEAGLLKRAINHDYITHGAYNLFALLVLANRWKGTNRETALRFLKTQPAPGTARKAWKPKRKKK